MSAPDSRSSVSLRSLCPSKIAHHMTDELSVLVIGREKTKRKSTHLLMNAFQMDAATTIHSRERYVATSFVLLTASTKSEVICFLVVINCDLFPCTIALAVVGLGVRLLPTCNK